MSNDAGNQKPKWSELRDLCMRVDLINSSCVLKLLDQLTEIDKLRAENEKLKETLSYLPKVPTEPYEKELAKKVLELRAENAELKDLKCKC